MDIVWPCFTGWLEISGSGYHNFLALSSAIIWKTEDVGTEPVNWATDCNVGSESGLHGLMVVSVLSPVNGG